MTAEVFKAPAFLRPLQLGAIKALVFDLDGTLAHSNPDFPAIREALGIASGCDILMHVNALPSAEQVAAMALVHQYELEAAGRSRWIDGAPELLALLSQQGRPTAILTRNTREAAMLTLSRLNLEVDLLLTREDAPPKPDPAGLLTIIGRLNLTPSEVLYVGDYLFDIETANRAGCPSALYCPGTVPDYAHLADVLVPCYLGLTGALSLAWGD
ncbi:HAD family hydrolase [Shewanella sp. JM162201]|uniref:HAD family hydrolase n=1 Tax=Shewanella jiangmenensis TaxID=2837387 RepID=A0ABS5V4I4_9GAMM|nr:HAD family hydrolase [Shewanella jiangmenensis]MBT1443968.1 HAD family hydrolase [Shewanella jiangmenensis]